MNQDDQVEQLKASLKRPEHTQQELDRRIFHLKTLYDVGKDIFASVDSDAILKNFLLMTMGNFGVMDGLILTMDLPSEEVSRFESLGFQDGDTTVLQESAERLLLQARDEGHINDTAIYLDFSELAGSSACTLAFRVTPELLGILALGGKLTGDPYTEEDKELLATLVNNLCVALRNARSFEDITHLNRELREKNLQLERTLDELRTALRKVELLEDIKANLKEFVPVTVSRLIERSPNGSIPEGKEQDVSVLFLDIQDYTSISEKLASEELHRLVEQYLSICIEAIHSNNGDVNEPTGDGFMVLFLEEDERENALNAVRAAVTIAKELAAINESRSMSAEPLVVNIGVDSGRAYVGATKFESYTGPRSTYTARGMVTNLAARICDVASDGSILVSGSTAGRIKDRFVVSPLGSYSLKNVSEDVEIFTVMDEIAS